MIHRRFLPVFLVAAWMLLPATAGASQLIANGGFAEGLSGWRTTEQVTKVKPSPDGNKDLGSVKFELFGGRVRGSGSASQDIPFAIPPGSNASISFSWRKNWLGAQPVEQSAVVQIIQPDGKTIDVWSDKTPNSANIWNSTTVDVSEAMSKGGKYAVRLSASFENGAGATSGNEICFDNIALSVPVVAPQPSTSILTPTGSTTLAGRTQLVSGVTNDDTAVDRVELSFRRAGDGFFWNGSSWTASETWIPATIVTGNGKTATWTYGWTLPTLNGEKVKLSARATDVAGNTEWPRSVDLTIDTVAPTGALYIEDAASFIRNRRVKIENQVTGAARMRFSVDNGRSWSKWDKFAQRLELDLPAGDATKIVTGEFKDDVGNSFRISDTIVLDSTAPVTKMTFPSPNATKIKSASTIGAVFYEEMNGTTLKNDGTEQGSTFYLKQGSAWVTGSVVYDNSSKTAKFIPAAPLADGTIYTAYLTTGVEDAPGNKLAADYSWSFTTSGSAKLSLSGKVTKSGGGKIFDGSGLIDISIPPNAVRSDTNVTLSEVKEDEANPAGLVRFSGIYKIGPDNLKLTTQALLRIKYQPIDGIDESTIRVFIFDSQTKQWTPASTRLDVTGNVAIANFDKSNIFTIAARADSEPPSASILTPTGFTILSGRTALIGGTAGDDFAVSRVEVTIVRLKDNFYWNNGSWAASESWTAAGIISKSNKNATWSFSWPLPMADGQSYRIQARAVDGGGNRSLSPAVAYVSMPGK